MITTLNDFIREYTKIKNMGWITTHRSGPTGIGKTLEDLLGIPENNYHEPDFGEYELKSCRLDSNSMLTMFTQTPQPARANTYLREKYGYFSNAYDNDEKVLHATLTASRFVPISNTGHQLRIVCDPDKISIASEGGVKMYSGIESPYVRALRKNTKQICICKSSVTWNWGCRRVFLYRGI
jgi:hypothetical protein